MLSGKNAPPSSLSMEVSRPRSTLTAKVKQIAMQGAPREFYKCHTHGNRCPARRRISFSARFACQQAISSRKASGHGSPQYRFACRKLPPLAAASNSRINLPTFPPILVTPRRVKRRRRSKNEENRKEIYKQLNSILEVSSFPQKKTFANAEYPRQQTTP